MKSRSIPIILAFCVSLTAPPLVSTSYAQSIPKSTKKRVIAIGKQLHITRKQAKQLLPILKAEGPQLQAIRNNPSLSRAEKLQQLQAVHARLDPQVKTILTPQQYAQVQVHLKQRRALLMQEIENQAKSQTQGSAARSATPPEPHQK
jgi:hypothetical protein